MGGINGTGDARYTEISIGDDVRRVQFYRRDFGELENCNAISEVDGDERPDFIECGNNVVFLHNEPISGRSRLNPIAGKELSIDQWIVHEAQDIYDEGMNIGFNTFFDFEEALTFKTIFMKWKRFNDGWGTNVDLYFNTPDGVRVKIKPLIIDGDAMLARAPLRTNPLTEPKGETVTFLRLINEGYADTTFDDIEVDISAKKYLDRNEFNLSKIFRWFYISAQILY